MINEVLFKIGESTWYYTKEALPWLIIGFLIAGLLKAFVPEGFLFKYLGARNMRSVLNATLIGIPLPLCSCGVIPAGIGLYEQGVSRASTLVFLIATPTTAITTILISIGLLGIKFTITIVGVALLIAFLTGSVALILLKDEELGKTAKNEDKHRITLTGIATCKMCRAEAKKGLNEAFRYGFIEMGKDIGPYIIIGLLAAGIISAFVPQTLIESYLGGGMLPLIMILIIGTPMYICSAASIPFVAALLAKGMSTAAALVFLIVGPATNIATIHVIE